MYFKKQPLLLLLLTFLLHLSINVNAQVPPGVGKLDKKAQKAKEVAEKKDDVKGEIEDEVRKHVPADLQDIIDKNVPQSAPCDTVIEGKAEAVYRINMGTTNGNFILNYVTYQVPDKIALRYQGEIIKTIDCPSTGESWWQDTTAFSGEKTEIDIIVRANCEESSSSTGWKFKVECHSKLVEKIKLGKVIEKKGAYEIYEDGEIFYRTVSEDHYRELVETNRMPGTGECTTSPNKDFSKDYDGRLIKFKVKPGTIDKLIKIGVTDGTPLVKAQFGDMKESFKGWNTLHARFKTETLKSTGKQQVNIALGKGLALEIFNDNIIEFQLDDK